VEVHVEGVLLRDKKERREKRKEEGRLVFASLNALAICEEKGKRTKRGKGKLPPQATIPEPLARTEKGKRKGKKGKKLSRRWSANGN